jgi:hypothetical protein
LTHRSSLSDRNKSKKATSKKPTRRSLKSNSDSDLDPSLHRKETKGEPARKNSSSDPNPNSDPSLHMKEAERELNRKDSNSDPNSISSPHQRRPSLQDIQKSLNRIERSVSKLTDTGLGIRKAASSSRSPSPNPNPNPSLSSLRTENNGVTVRASGLPLTVTENNIPIGNLPIAAIKDEARDWDLELRALIAPVKFMKERIESIESAKWWLLLVLRSAHRRKSVLALRYAG